MRPERLAYLEGLRGIAAVQVVLLHFVSGFLPETAGHAPALLRVLWDGHTAVYVFFLISGAVLTPSFARGGAWPRQALKRFVRLGVPVVAAAVIALVLVAAWPDAHRIAAGITGSDWLAMDSSGTADLPHLLREIALDSLLLGYREYTLFAPIADRLPLLENALNAPTWSLHLELYGSLLVLGLVTLRAAAPRAHWVAVAACAMLFGTHPMVLFVAGHLCAGLMARKPPIAIGAGLIVVGLLLSATNGWSPIETIRLGIERVAPVAAPNLFQFQSQLAAVALFVGVLLSAPARCVLARFQTLGRLSFSVYLLHFPILFTVTCAAFPWLAGTLPRSAAVAATFAGFVLLVFTAAAVFERTVDRPAVRLSRLIDGRR